MLGLIKRPSGNGTAYSVERAADRKPQNLIQPTDIIQQIKMMDLRALMKEEAGVRLGWANNKYEGKCPFHDDPLRSPRLHVSLDPRGVWLWRCDGGHHGGSTIDFVKEAKGLGDGQAIEYLKKKLKREEDEKNGGISIKEILSVQRSAFSVQEKQKGEIASRCSDRDRSASPLSTSLETSRNDACLLATRNPQLETPVDRTDDSATFKYGELVYTAKDLKSTTKHCLKIILKLTHKDGHFTDRIDLHSARARRSFANQASERLNLQSAQIEEHLESMMEELETSVQRSASSVQESKTTEMTEEEKREALELLRDPDLLGRMASDLDRLGYVGETTNKKILYLVATSRLLEKPISAIIRSRTAAGKSKLMEYVLEFIPKESSHLFTRLSAKSLFYMSSEELDRKVVAVDEREGSQDADYSIRSLQSRGKLSMATAGKDPKTGSWKTYLKEFSARTPYMESSTKDKINEENLNRCFELYLDESPEQTKKIQESLRKKAAREGMTLEEESKLKKLYHNAQTLLRVQEVRIPQELQIDFPYQTLRARRDYEKFLSLIKAVTVLHQYQRTEDRSQKIDVREPITGPSSDASQASCVLTATLKDYQIAQELTRAIFDHTTGDLSQPLSKFYEILKKKVHEVAKDISIEDFSFTRRDIRTWLALPDHVVKGCMRNLEDLEYVLVKHSSRTSRKSYSLCVH